MKTWKASAALFALGFLLVACGSAPPPLPPRLDEASSFAEKGVAAFRSGCMDEAETYFLASLELHRSLDDREGVGGDLNRMSVLYAARGRIDQALEALDQAERINRSGNHVSALFANLLNRARIYIQAGRWDEAGNAMNEARLLSPLGEEELFSWFALKGYWHLEQGQTGEAVREFEEAEKRARPETAPRPTAALELHIARAFRAMGRLTDAFDRTQRALELDKKAAYAPGIGEDLVLLCILAEQLDKPQESAELAERAFYVHYYLGHEAEVRELADTLERLNDHARLKRLKVYLEKGEREGFHAYCP